MLYCGTTLKSEKEVFLTHVIYPTQASIVHSLISSPASSYYKEWEGEERSRRCSVSHWQGARVISTKVTQPCYTSA